jgi:hypothetical protein
MRGIQPVAQIYIENEKSDRVCEIRPKPLQLNIVCAPGVFYGLILICSGILLVCVYAIEVAD